MIAFGVGQQLAPYLWKTLFADNPLRSRHHHPRHADAGTAGRDGKLTPRAWKTLFAADPLRSDLYESRRSRQ